MPGGWPKWATSVLQRHSGKTPSVWAMYYASPELVNQQPMWPRSDCWAIAIIFIESMGGPSPVMGPVDTSALDIVEIKRSLLPEHWMRPPIDKLLTALQEHFKDDEEAPPWMWREATRPPVDVAMIKPKRMPGAKKTQAPSAFSFSEYAGRYPGYLGNRYPGYLGNCPWYHLLPFTTQLQARPSPAHLGLGKAGPKLPPHCKPSRAQPISGWARQGPGWVPPFPSPPKPSRPQ